MKLKSISATSGRQVRARRKIVATFITTALAIIPVFVALQNINFSSALVGTAYLGGVQDGSDLLRIALSDDGGTNPQRYSPAGNCSLTPGSNGSCWTREYYASNGNGVVLYANGQVMFWGGNNNANFGAKSSDVNITVGQSVLSANTEKITRTWTGTGPASGIVLNETISLVKGSIEYSRMIDIVNNTGSALTDVRLIVGGDTYFSGDDYGYTGHNTSNGNTVYVYKDATHGAMFFSGLAATPADRYFAGSFTTGHNQAKSTAMLGNTVSGPISYVDTSYYLQWGEGSQTIPAGGTLSIGMSETVTDATTTNIQIAAPPSQTADENTTVDLVFKVLSLAPEPVSLSGMTAISQHGFSTSVSPTSADLTFGEVADITVSVTIPIGATPNLIDKITLTVPFAGDTSGSESASTNIIVNPQPATITDVTPNVGRTTGGNNVTITGTNFHELLTVEVGGAGATIVSVTPTQMVIKAPAHAAGFVDIDLNSEFLATVTSPAAYEYVEAKFLTGNQRTKSASEDLVYRVSRDVDLVDSVLLNSEELDPEWFDIMVSGNASETLVTIPAEILNLLDAGTYTIGVVYADGFAVEDSFNIANPLSVPNTGLLSGDDGSSSSSSNVASTIMIISTIGLLSGAAYMMLRSRKTVSLNKK